jgi:hypothetical protein
MPKLTDPRTGAVLDCTIQEALEILAALPTARPAAPTSDLYAKKQAIVAAKQGLPITRRSVDERQEAALKLAHALRDAGARGASGVDLAHQLKIAPKGLGGLKVILGGIAKDAGLHGVDDIVKMGGRLKDGGSLWKPGPGLSKAIDYLEGRLGQPSANGTH